jgi:hypothetical protein
MVSIRSGLFFVKTHRKPKDEKYSWFVKEQVACRKDVERAFGIFQSRWAIVRHPAKQWSFQQMWKFMTVCVLMHNMIVEEERDDTINGPEWDFQGKLVAPNLRPASFQDFLHVHHGIRDRATHHALHENSVNHIWIHAVNNPVANPENNPF